MRYSPRVDRIAGEGAAAWRIHMEAVDARQRGEDIIVMSIGDPDFATPPAIVETAVQALQAGDTHYTGIAGRQELRAAIAREVEACGGPAVTAENVIVLAGAQNALFSASLCLFSPGDEVIVLDPMYVTYEATVQVSGAKLVSVPALPDSGFRPDLDAIEEAVTERSRAIMFANPCNPSGVVLTREELEGIAEIARRHDLWVISDEVYGSLTFEQDHIMIAGLPEMAERTVTAASLSKSQAMTGWRTGWMVGPKELIAHAEHLSLCMLYGLPGFIQQAALTALGNARGEMDRMRDIYLSRRNRVIEGLEGAGKLSVVPSESGMFLLVDVRETGMTSLDFAWALYREEGVSLLDAAAFGSSTAGYVRLSYTLGDEALDEGCRRICRFVSRL
ncbi:pyridoxal phosphate-dependent aminotransferase [Pelagibius sp. Alg239-R121]|uniref:pyridoxal phosphate-dependent aminotransferase n=1 Tax=Pelagibius sp. Alg239-R121 TaxID=2993448 RepID=UPI0024A787FC|nr:aminotransferase class I/II-fold pyridoxal phosphate-dependent enzyme [Pelagibius sp. Alg239-R121]